jgi:hypothetical protein
MNMERESFIIDLHMENISEYNLKKTISTSQNDLLLIKDFSLDEKISEIEVHFDTLKKTSKL